MSAEGILIVGLNGCGKTTLGRALADAPGYDRMDVEDYYFLPGANPYAASRSRDEVRRLIAADIRRHPRFVLSSVNGDWGGEILARVKAVIWLSAALDVRLERVDRRSSERFGRRVAPGGDMYEQERRFRDLAAARTERPIEDWLASTRLPALRVDATTPADEVLSRVIRWLESLSNPVDKQEFGEGTGNRAQGTGIVAAARQPCLPLWGRLLDAAAAFPVPCSLFPVPYKSPFIYNS